MPTGQKRAPEPITDRCEPPCGCWELNSGPLEEQAMLLTSEPSLQPSQPILFKTDCFLILKWYFLFKLSVVKKIIAFIEYTQRVLKLFH